MPLSERLVKLPELAQALDRSEDWIKRNWLKIHLEKGFPRKCSVGWVWPRGALERWFEEGAGGAVREDEHDVETDRQVDALATIVANQNSRLRHRYAGGRA